MPINFSPISFASSFSYHFHLKKLIDSWQIPCNEIFKSWQNQLLSPPSPNPEWLNKFKIYLALHLPTKLADAITPSLPTDPQLRLKKLDNGFTYYLRQNAYPYPKKASLQLVVRTGFINEKKNERGIAHLIEHIAQIETASFKKEEILQYLYSKGVTWGGDNNAYTSIKQTVYKLNIPLDDPETLEKVLQILSETAFQATLSDSAIDHEREIVIDELRQRNDYASRHGKAVSKILFNGTPYANIQDFDLEIKNVKDCPAETIRKFYRRWYQPYNMALIGVGDFDVDKTEGLIKKYFGNVSKNESKGKVSPLVYSYSPPEDLESHFICNVDPEIRISSLEIYYKLKPEFQPHNRTLFLKNIKKFLINELFEKLLNARFDELTDSQDSPFLVVQGLKSNLVPGETYFRLVAGTKEGFIKESFKEILTELKKIKEFGFLESEFEEIKQNFLSGFEHAILEKDKISSKTYVSKYLDHFIEHNPAPSLEQLRKAQRDLLKTITLKDINQACLELLPEETFIVCNMPEKETLSKIEEKEVRQIIQDVKNETVTPYVATTDNRPLMTELPSSGKIIQTQLHEEVMTTQYTLENGLNVYVKPTTFQNDKVNIYGFSLKGHRDAPLEQLHSAKFADEFYEYCGIADFSLKELKKVLKGKNVELSSSINSYVNSLDVLSGKQDIETAFQLLHLSFVNPGYNRKAFDKALKFKEELLRNRDNNPMQKFIDEINAVNTQKHPYLLPTKIEDLVKIDYDLTTQFHQNLYKNPADFKIIIVGNVDQDTIKPLIERYLASLPICENAPKLPYSPVPFPEGVIRKEIYAGTDASCISFFSFPAPISDSLHSRLLAKWSGEIFNTRLKEILRFKMGKTYSTSSSFLNQPAPNLNPHCPSKALITVSCDPINLPEIEQAIVNEIRQIQEEGPTEKEVSDLKAILQEGQSKVFNTNTGWLTALGMALIWDQELNSANQIEKEIGDLNAESVKECLNHIFPLNNYSMVTLFPKKESEEEKCDNKDIAG